MEWLLTIVQQMLAQSIFSSINSEIVFWTKSIFAGLSEKQVIRSQSISLLGFHCSKDFISLILRNVLICVFAGHTWRVGASLWQHKASTILIIQGPKSLTKFSHTPNIMNLNLWQWINSFLFHHVSLSNSISLNKRTQYFSHYW
jgi:hypothetical protein